MTPATPADLALELGVGQTRIREFLRQEHGILPSGTTRWVLEDSDADKVRTHFRATEIDPLTWSLEIGDIVRRRQIHAAYGGQEQGGIITPRSLPNDIIVVTDPESGAEYGYDEFDGLQPDGTFWYTGEGQVGNQTFRAGNRALRDAAEDGRVIRVMTKAGVYVTYAGAFTLGEHGYRIETIPDRNNNPRQGIVFELVPLEADLALLAPAHAPTGRSVTKTEWTAPDPSDFIVPIDPERAFNDRVVTRVEFQLQSDFGNWLRAQDIAAQRLQLHIGPLTIEPDMYVETKQWVVEAKRSTSREHVRMAIGQVLDYANIARKQTVRAVPAILLPGRPDSDLAELIDQLGIVLISRDGEGFHVAEPSE